MTASSLPVDNSTSNVVNYTNDTDNGNMMTLTPQLSFTATNSGINESNALNYWNSRTVADDFRDFFDKTVLKGINTNFIFRRGLAGINLIRIPFVDNHYNNNKNLKFNDYITDQLTGNAAKAKMGFDFLGSNAWGWVAVYNALVSIDNYKHPADIIRYIERTMTD